MANKPRIAIVGFVLESNGHAPVVGRDDFIRFSGQEIPDDLRRDAPRSPAELSGFVDRLTALRDWEPVPITIQSGGAAGPVDQTYFDGFMTEVTTGWPSPARWTGSTSPNTAPAPRPQTRTRTAP